jgi:hypothetical protein
MLRGSRAIQAYIIDTQGAIKIFPRPVGSLKPLTSIVNRQSTNGLSFAIHD